MYLDAESGNYYKEAQGNAQGNIGLHSIGKVNLRKVLQARKDRPVGLILQKPSDCVCYVKSRSKDEKIVRGIPNQFTVDSYCLWESHPCSVKIANAQEVGSTYETLCETDTCVPLVTSHGECLATRFCIDKSYPESV